jgi:hypothetical protein
MQGISVDRTHGERHHHFNAIHCQCSSCSDLGFRCTTYERTMLGEIGHVRRGPDAINAQSAFDVG